MKYGYIEKVTEDVETLNLILDRQGSSLLLDVIAEKVGHQVNKYKFTDIERKRVVDSLLKEFKEALLERV